MASKNKSERVFERYLNSNGFKGKWEYEPSLPGKNRHPDYLLNWKEKECFFEVKELRKKANEPAEWPAYIDPYSSLRAKINEAREKFKEFKEYRCSLVVFNVDDLQVRLKPLDVLSAMLGNLGFEMDFDADKGKAVKGTGRNCFLSSGKMIDGKGKQPQNTTISTIVVLECFRNDIEIKKAIIEEIKKQNEPLTLEKKVEINIGVIAKHHSIRVPRVLVVENPFARINLPETLFIGPFDECWRLQKDGKFNRFFVGKKLNYVEILKKEIEHFN